MRKAFVIFYSTLGSTDEVTTKCFNHLLRMEGALNSKYQYLPLEQLAMSLMEYLENELEDDGEEYLPAVEPEPTSPFKAIGNGNDNIKAIKAG